MFKKILFATTASPTCDAAAKVAFDLAGQYNAELFIFHVFGIPTRGASPFITDVRTGEEETLDDDYIAWVKEEMQNTYAAQLRNMPKAVIDCTVGSPASQILRQARKENVDLIVMGSHARREDIGAYRNSRIAGSTMQRVARGADCPVLIVSQPCNTCFRYFSSIVLGTDFSKAAMAAFQFALRTARHIDSRLHLFHTVDISEVHFDRTAGRNDIEQRIAEARRRIAEIYIPHMQGFGNYAVEVRRGIPHAEILKFAQEENADLIVMAHHIREVDPEKALMGSTVEQVVLHSACPVVSVNRSGKVQPNPVQWAKKETVQ
jgi:nucleotide-binding universal stress UspA family protein